jgi:hypothetical protein|tara:strand:- start:34389 stop:35150 length:762 start_codon:yes stop_codon:yes gene_type:complete
MVSYINPILALVATGHAFDKHVLGKGDGGEKEFSERRFGPRISISSYQDAAKMLHDIVHDKKNTTVAYNPDDGYLSLVNTAKNVLVALSGGVRGGDCGTFMRPHNPSNNPEAALNCLMRKTKTYSSSEDAYKISNDPEEIAAIVEEFSNNIRPSKEAIARLKTPEVLAVTKTLKLRDKFLADREEKAATAAEETTVANRFLKAAKHSDESDYDIVVSGSGGSTITYLAKDDVQEIKLGEKQTNRVLSTLGMTA